MAKSSKSGPPAKTQSAPPSTPSEGEFAQELAKRVGNLVGREKAGSVVAQVISLVESERFSGPIAHPRHLREYEQICPGSADRIISMAERNLEHSHKMQSKALDGQIKDHLEGRKYGFFALVLLIVGAIISALMKDTTLAALFLGAGALGTVGAIIKGVRAAE